MTVTPGREELERALTAVLSEGGWPIYRTEDDRGLEVGEYLDLFQNVLSRLAAKPSDEGVREATIEECAKLATSPRFAGLTKVGTFKGPKWTEETGNAELMNSHARSIAVAIRALSTTGEPKR